MGGASQLIVASLYSPDGNVDTLSVSVISRSAPQPIPNCRSAGIPAHPM